jgi:hypothetical protein
MSIIALAATSLYASAQVLTFDQAKQRADQGDAFAQGVVALHYQLGWNTEKNPQMAAKYAIASANAREPLGKFRLGALLRAGEGVPKDEQRGLAYQAASFEGLNVVQDPYSITALGILIFQGKVVAQNIPKEERYKEAARLYKMAAEMGFVPAQFNYAMALNDGHGVTRNPAGCQKYLSEALLAEYPPAQKFALEQTEALSKRGVDNPSAVEGVNYGGERWAYEFLDSQSDQAKLGQLHRIDSKVLLFADDEWIVLGDDIHLGLGRNKFLLSFYDARSLSRKAVVSVPNAVFHIDRSPERNQWLAVTAAGVADGRYRKRIAKHPDDIAQALVLIDLGNKQIERVRLWQQINDEDFNYADRCAPMWKGDAIEITFSREGGGTFGLPVIDARPTSRVFSDVLLKFRESPERSGLACHSSEVADSSSLSTAGINYDVGNSSRVGVYRAPHQTGSAGLASGGARKGVNLTHSVPKGGLVAVNLSTLKSTSHKVGNVALDDVGMFEDGTLYASSGENVFLARDEALIARSLPSIHPEQRYAFGSNAVYFFSQSQTLNRSEAVIGIFDSSGDSNSITVDISAGSTEGEVALFDIDPNRHSLGVIRGGMLDGMFNEYSWKDGRLLREPFFCGNPRGTFDRTAGVAPNDWVVESLVIGHTTQGVDYGVFATCVSSGRRYEVAVGSEASLCGAPVMRLRDSRSALILSTGSSEAKLFSLNTENGEVRAAAKLEWNKLDGFSFFEPSTKWLFVPTGLGYAIYEPFSDIPLRKLADVLIGRDEQYAILLPNGIYAGSPGCESLLRLKAGDGSVDGSSIAQWRNRPAEVLKALGGDPEQIEVLAKVTERWHKRIGFDPTKPEPKAPDLPKVSVPERPPLWAESDQVTFPVEWQAGASPVSKIIVRVNGVESVQFEGEALPAANENKGIVDASIKLAEGQNWIEVTAEDVEGRRSDLQRFRTILKDSPTETKRYIVALGVSDYAKSELNLQFAAKDANDLLKALAGPGAQVSDHVLLLTNDQVDRSAVEKICEFVAKSSESDEVILFCAGHGVLDDKLDYYFAGHDFDSDRPAETGIKLDDLVNAVSSAKALRRLILLDTCHAGVVGEKDEMLLAQMDTKLPAGVRAVAQRGMKVQQAADFSASDKQRFIEEMFALPGTIRGVNIIGASAGAQFALESDQWNNGVFTASVIEGLRDKKADWNQDGRIMVSELKNYLGQRVSELTAGAQKPSVVAFEQDQDFDLLN